MDVTGIAKLATSIAETGTKMEVDVAILKRAQQIESTNASALLASIPAPQPVSTNLPPNLGQNINTTA
jgi:hypothetical protein